MRLRFDKHWHTWRHTKKQSVVRLKSQVARLKPQIAGFGTYDLLRET